MEVVEWVELGIACCQFFIADKYQAGDA